MFHEMRRSRQQLSQEESIAILERGTHGVLALSGDDGYPYAVPLSYVYHDGKLFFHCATSGHKLDAVAHCDKASFCVVDQDRVIPEKYTTAYRSAIAFGHIRILTDREEIIDTVRRLDIRYGSDGANHQREIDSWFPRVRILELTIEHLTGKQGSELLKD